MSRAAPHLTYFVELAKDRLVDLFATPGLVDFLARSRASVSMGLLDLSSERAAKIGRAHV